MYAHSPLHTPIHTHIHPFTHRHIHPFMYTSTHRRRSRPCKVTASSSGALRVRCLARGHLNTRLGGAGDRTSILPVTSQPGLPPELPLSFVVAVGLASLAVFTLLSLPSRPSTYLSPACFLYLLAPLLLFLLPLILLLRLHNFQTFSSYHSSSGTSSYLHCVKPVYCPLSNHCSKLTYTLWPFPPTPPPLHLFCSMYVVPLFYLFSFLLFNVSK